MKNLILSLLSLVFAVSAWAQSTGNATEASQWLTEFTEIQLNGPFHLVIELVPDTEAPRISYDTKGSYTSKFRAEVKNGVLQISERAEARRETVTEVRLRCHRLDKIRIAGATVSFAQPLEARMMDMTVSSGGVLTAALDMTDLQLEATGKSRVILTGQVRYLSLTAASSKVDASQLKVVAAQVEASNGAEVTVDVAEWLRAKTSTDARITYAGDPSVVRSGKSFTGGDIVSAL